jgi:hypothetical protein
VLVFLNIKTLDVNKETEYTGNTQKIGAVSIVIPIEPAPFVCVCTVFNIARCLETAFTF